MISKTLAEKILKEEEARVAQHMAKGFGCPPTTMLLAIMLKVALKQGLYVDPKPQEPPKATPKKRGRPKGSKNRKKA